MNKTIKIIDLLNKNANGEEVPEKIKYRNCIFNKTFGAGINPNYVNYDNTYLLEYVSNEADSLNELVEILEDNTEEIEETNLCYVTCESDFKNMNIVKLLNEFFEKNDLIVNELARAVNQIRKEKE